MSPLGTAKALMTSLSRTVNDLIARGLSEAEARSSPIDET
jgi:hypothetical protein